MNIICQKGVWEEREDERKEFYFPVSTHYLEFLPHRSIHSSVFAKTKTSGYLSLGERGVGNWLQGRKAYENDQHKILCLQLSNSFRKHTTSTINHPKSKPS